MSTKILGPTPTPDREARSEDIDLEAIKQRADTSFDCTVRANDQDLLIAAVEALRERAAELEAKKWDMQHSDTMNDMTLLGADRDSWKILAESSRLRAESAEALNKEMVGILEAVDKAFWDLGYTTAAPIVGRICAVIKKARP